MKNLLSKITFAFILSITLIITGFAINAFAATVVDDIEWEYKVNDDKTSVTITGAVVNTKKTKNFKIPESILLQVDGVIKECYVTDIDKSAFTDSANKIYGTLTLPQTLKTIGDDAFTGTHISGKITIPNSVKTIGAGAFSNCKEEITEIVFPEGITTIPEKFIYNSNFIGTLSIPYSVETIGKNAFAGSNINGELVVPYSVKTINERAFEDCNDITTIVLYNEPSSTNTNTNKSLTVGNYAFNNCASITSITLGSGVKSIGTNAFANIPLLCEVNYNATTANDLSTSTLAFQSSGKEGTGIVLNIGKYVTKIPNNLFYADKASNTSRLTSIAFADNCECTTIGNGSFTNSYFLTNIKIPDSVTKISSNAFNYCYSLVSITLGANLATIENDAFKDCYKLVEVYNLSSKITVTAKNSGNGCVGYYAKDVFVSLSEKSHIFTTENGFIMFDNGESRYLLTYAGADETAVFPEDCNGNSYEIYEYAFYNYPLEISVVLNENDKNYKISSIAKYAFYGAPLVDSLNIPDSVKYIGEYAFANCKGKISSLTLSNNLTTIENHTFENSYIAANFKFPDKLVSIGDNAFSSTYIMGDFVFHDGLASIGSSAFQNCYGITSLKLPITLTEIKSNTFINCLSLRSVNLNYITAFGEKCFHNCQSLLHVEFGSKVTSIGSEAFRYCYSLMDIVDLSMVEKMNCNAFNDCTRLEGFVLPNIDDLDISKLISGCSNINTFKVKDGDNSFSFIGDKLYIALNGVLFNITKYSECDKPQKGDTTIVIDNKTYKVDETTLVLYPYKKTTKTYTVPTHVTKIGNGAFQSASFLEEVIIGNNVVEIGNDAFKSSALKTAYIPLSVKTINDGTFTECKNLEWVVFEKNVDSVGNAFTDTMPTIVYAKNKLLGKPNGVTPSRFRNISSYQCTNHIYGYLDVAPTCTEYGYNQCAFCNKVEFVKELGHSGPIIEKSLLSCTTDSYSKVLCDICGMEELLDFIPSTGHKSNYTVVNVTSSTPGYTIANCTVCHETYIAEGTYIPHLEDPCSSHNYITASITSPSCKTNGLKISYCKHCGELSNTVVIPKKACKFVFSYRIESSCQVNGQIVEVCSVCQTQRVTKLDLAPHDHNWYTVENNKGYEYSTCSVCGLFETNIVDYSAYERLLKQVSKYYKTYYAPETVALLSPIMENRNLNLTQEAVDYNANLLQTILSNLQYNVTDVPVVFIEYEGLDDVPGTTLIPKTYGDAKIHVASMNENGERQIEAIDFNAEIRGRGNSTHNGNKCPYNIRFSNEVDLLGMGAGKKYCLMANLYDQTLIRNATVIEFAKLLGLPYTPNYEMVEVYLNNKYIGVYMLTTPMDVDENRIEINDETDFLLELENKNSAGEGEVYLTIDGNKIPSTYMHLLVESPEDMGALSYSTLISTLYQINIAIFSENWEIIKQHVDVDSVAKFYMLHEYLKEVDIYYDSTRFFIQDGKLYGGPVWDFDYGLGNVTSGGGNNGSHTAYNNGNADYVKENGGTELGVVQGVYDSKGKLDDINWASTTGYWARGVWENGTPNGFFDELYLYSDEFIELVSQYVKDYGDQMTALYTTVIDEKFYKNEAFTAARIRNTSVYGIANTYSGTSNIKISYNHAINYLKEWLQRRHEWMKLAYIETDARP